MYRSKRRLPAEQKAQVEDTLQKIEDLFKANKWLTCLDRPTDDGQMSMAHGLGSHRYGRIDTVASVIYVDFRVDFLAMFIHQCIHAIYPTMNERDVTILELITVEYMDAEQAVNMLRILLDHSMHRLFSQQKPKKSALMLEIQKLFDTGHWLVRLDQLRGETDLSIIYNLGRNCHGFLEEDVRVMYVDFREDLLSTFIHECLHIIYPNHDELAIGDLEKSSVDDINARQAECLLRMMMQNLY